MHVLLDHITAFIIATVLFVSLFTMINRSRQNAVEMQIGQMVQEQAYDFMRVIEQDLENIRSQAQVISRNTYLEPDILDACEFTTDTEGRTTRLIFPTLANQKQGANSDIINVEYVLEPTGDKLTYLEKELDIFTINRYVHTGDSTVVRTHDGSSGNFITHFAITMHTAGVGGTDLSDTAFTGTCPPDGSLAKTHIEMQAALPTVDYVEGNQRSTSNLNVTRFSAVVYSPNR